jgi:putative heme-binding domain-containing protein
MTVFRLDASGEPVLLEIMLGGGLKPGGRLPKLQVTMQVGDDPKTERPVNNDQLSLSWVPTPPPLPLPLENVPDLKGGDPERGAQVFKSDAAKCASCHKVRGEGGNVGPDLSSLVEVDRLSVYRDLFAPSERIHPDYVAYNIVTKDGRVLVGTVRAEGANAVRVINTEAKSLIVPRSEIEEFRPSATSIMPVGLIGVIGEDKLRDLIAYLTTRPKK